MTQFKGFAGNSEAQLRQIIGYLFQQEAVGLARDGVLTGLGVTQTTTASTGVVVAKGFGIVQDSALAGAVPLVSDTNLTLDVLTANPLGGLPRNDLIVFDAATIDPATGTGGIRVLTGTPNASPTDPTVPATAIPLARLRHFSSATTIPAGRIDDLRIPTNLYSRIVGTGGYPTIPASGGPSAFLDIVFPAGMFTDQPVVQVSRSGQAYDVTYSGANATGFRATATRKDGGNITGDGVSFSWTATQYL